jgi:EpsD family peptidyl-prolyl cis-trans isomerase
MTVQLATEAVARRLDRAPQVLRAMESAKTEVLARAYLEELGRAQPDPSPAEVHQYYAAHPELFAERRIFTLEQIDVPRGHALATALRERATSPGATLESLAEWLRARDVPHSLTRGVRAADRIPLELLPRLQAMKEGELAVMESGDALLVIRVRAQRHAPLDEAAAAPLIEQFLRQRNWEEAVGTELRRLRLTTRIE